ncbi:hypothetical protein BFW01_g3436 [Lasiodiplodia theobromae]|nr:hypothetical protein BFW01_g3436 [Lasiodiplodia theobromae]
MGFSRFDIGDPHDEDAFADWEEEQDEEHEFGNMDNAFEEWLRTSLPPTNMNEQLPDISDSEGSYEDSTDAEEAQH